MRILIIGGGGFIGSHLVARLKEHHITLLHRHRGSDVQDDNVHHLIADRADLAGMRDRIAAGNYDVAIDMISYNDMHAQTVIKALNGLVDRVVVVSSGSVYQSFGRLLASEPGPIQNEPFEERDALRVRRYPYADHFPRFESDPMEWLANYDKIAVEEAYISMAAFHTCIVRLPMVYGAGDPDNRVGVYLEEMKKSNVIWMEETAAQWRNSRSHVENVALALSLVVERGDSRGIYNISESADLPELEWIETIGRAAGWNGAVEVTSDPEKGIKPLISEFPQHANYQQHLRMDSSRIRKELNYAECLGLGQALEKTVMTNGS